MALFSVIGSLVALIAIFGYLNARFLKLPNAIGVAAVGLFLSILGTLVGYRDPTWIQWAEQLVAQVDFQLILLHGVLGLLLFAGALSTNVKELQKQWLPVLLMATVAVIISTFVVGAALWGVVSLLAINVPPLYCFIFGALVSPTDPVAVLSVLRKCGLSARMEATIAGESLFNDGTGVAVYLVLLGLVTGASPAGLDFMAVAHRMGVEIAGGILVGLGLGAFVLFLLKTIDDFQVELMISLGVATGGYALAESLHVSAPLAVVVAGLLLGSLAPNFACSTHSQAGLHHFWEAIDSILNLLLFGFIGILVLSLDFTLMHVMVAICAVPVVLFGRWISVLIPAIALWPANGFNLGVVSLMTWGGLRGGVSLALALSLPQFYGRSYVIAATYGVVVFSLLVQALSLGPYVRWLQDKGSLSK